MPKLATVESYRARFGAPDTDSTNEKIAATLEAASVHLSSLLQTGFDAVTHTDIYWVDSEEFPFVDQFVRLRLRNGFVDSSATFEVRTASLVSELSSQDPLDLSDAVVDYEAGLILLTYEQNSYYQLSNPITDRWFAQVDYTAGFQTQSDAYQGSVYQNVPSWLSEAALLQAYGMMEGVCDPKRGNPVCDSVIRLLEGKIRAYPSALRPI